MTPTWLEAHASHIHTRRILRGDELTFYSSPINKWHVALLKVPLISAGVLKVDCPLTVEIAVANDVGIGNGFYNDIKYGVSDGDRFIGFITPGRGKYKSKAPCYGVEGYSGSSLSHLQYNPSTPKPREYYYPGQFGFTLKLDERWGSCYTAHDAGFVKTASYNNRLTLSKGLSLEVYKTNKRDRVGIKFIKVTVTKNGDC